MFLITGGGSGIGRALAQTLASRGNEVMIVGRREKALAEVASFSPLISYVHVDVSSEEGRQAILAHLGKVTAIKGLIHNAGIIEPISPIAQIHESDWRKVLETNLNAPLFLNQLLLKKLEDARVLSIGSGAAYFPVKGWSGYCVSKAALAMLIRCWQLEHPEIAFASVMPGIIDTDMQALIRDTQCMDKEKHRFFMSLKQEEKLLKPETVALFLSWLLLDLDSQSYSAQEWDIYDKSHHSFWLIPPHKVPEWEE